MAEYEEFLNVPESLTKEGEMWATKRFIEGKSEEITPYLKSSFVACLDIFQKHREILSKSIEQEGGVDKINHQGIIINSSNEIICKSGKIIYAPEILHTTILSKQVTPSKKAPPGTKQIYEINFAYGGRNLGIGSEEWETSDVAYLRADDPLDAFFTPEFFPYDICIEERVITSFKDNKSKRHVKRDCFSVSASIWEAKLREEFVPNPVFNPEAYEAWQNTPPVKIINMMFTASSQKHNGQMFTYINRYGTIRKPRRAMKRLERFHNLLQFSYQRMIGTDLPLLGRPA